MLRQKFTEFLDMKSVKELPQEARDLLEQGFFTGAADALSLVIENSNFQEIVQDLLIEIAEHHHKKILEGAKDDNSPLMPLSLDVEYSGAPESVHFSLLDEDMAMQIHSQSLDKLAGRGGLSPSEMLALMTNQNIFHGRVNDMDLYKMPSGIAIEEINKILISKGCK